MKKFTKLEDITDENLQEASAAAVQNFVAKYVSDQIEEASVEFADKLEGEKKAKEAEAAKVKEVQEQLEATIKEMQKVKEDLQKEQEARAAQKQEADFNNRMADLDSKFELNDTDRSFIVKDIKALDDNAYASWLEKFEVFAGAKKKANLTPEQLKKLDEEKKKNAKASAEELLRNSQENNNGLPPNNISTEPSVMDEFAEAFKFEVK